MCATVSSFIWVLGDLNSGPYTCVASDLPAEPSPQTSYPFKIIMKTLISPSTRQTLHREPLHCICAEQFYVSWTQAKVIREEGASMKKMPP